MNRLISRLVLSALVTMTVCAAASAATITVRRTGGVANFVGVDAITTAVQSAASGDVIQVNEGGTYNRVTFVGGKSYSVQGTVPGVVISGSGANSAASTSGSASAPLNLNLSNLSIINPSGTSGVAFVIQQHNTQSTSVGLTNCVVRQASTTTTQANDGIRIVSGTVNNGGVVRLTATNCTIESLSSNTVANNSQNPLTGALVTSGTATAATGLTGLTVTLTSCTVRNIAGAAVLWRGGTSTVPAYNNMVWNVTRSRIKNEVLNLTTSRRVFIADASHNNGVFNFTDTIISGPGEVFYCNNKIGVNNVWNLTRCTSDNRRGGSTSSTNNGTNWRLRYNSNTSTPFNQWNFTNTVFAQHGPGTGVFDNAANTSTTMIYCTVFKETGSSNSVWANQNQGNGGRIKVFNSLFVGWFNGYLPNPASASRGNIIASNGATAGSVVIPPLLDDTDFLPGGRTTCTIAQANLVHLIPQSTSPTSVAIGTAHTSSSVKGWGSSPNFNLQQVAGFVDRNGAPRWPLPSDVGAFESNAIGVPVELTGFAID